MKEYLNTVESLIKRIHSISERYSERYISELIEIFKDFDTIVSDLYNDNPHQWAGILNGMNHTENLHIYILKDHKSAKSSKTDSYKRAYEYILDDLEISQKWLSSEK